MKASKCSFEEIRELSKSVPKSAVSLSYFQVEHGLEYTEKLWNMYVETTEDDEDEPKSKKQICKLFGEALNDFREITEPPSYEVGSPLGPIS